MTELNLAEAARIMSQHRRKEVKQCERCGRVFEGVSFKRFCSRDCQRKAAYKRYRDRYRRKNPEGVISPKLMIEP